MQVYEVKDFSDCDPEVADELYVLVDASAKIEPGAIVVGTRHGQPSIWRYSPADRGDSINGRVIKSWTPFRS